MELSACIVVYNGADESLRAAQTVLDCPRRHPLTLYLVDNASPDGSREGFIRGIIAFYYPGSANGKRAADIFVRNLKDIYPLPDKVTTRPTTALGEVSRSRFPAVLVEIGYHDNYSDALWLESHVEDVARQLVKALTEYFGLPFIQPMDPKRGTVRLSYGTLNLRSTPSSSGTVIAHLPNGAEVTVYGEWNGWYVVQYGDQVGYAAAAYIDV